MWLANRWLITMSLCMFEIIVPTFWSPWTTAVERSCIFPGSVSMRDTLMRSVCTRSTREGEPSRRRCSRMPRFIQTIALFSESVQRAVVSWSWSSTYDLTGTLWDNFRQLNLYDDVIHKHSRIQKDYSEAWLHHSWTVVERIYHHAFDFSSRVIVIKIVNGSTVEKFCILVCNRWHYFVLSYCTWSRLNGRLRRITVSDPSPWTPLSLNPLVPTPLSALTVSNY